jgi:hypothetical protein
MPVVLLIRSFLGQLGQSLRPKDQETGGDSDSGSP